MTENLPVLKDQSLLLDTARFEHAQRVGNMLTKSTMVPEHFRNNIGNCVIALNYADRVGIDPFMAMQKMYVIHGKPAVETQLQIALFNNSSRFTTLKYKMSGNGDKSQCVAYATDRETKEEIDGPPVSIAMAKAEGWYGKKGSKWVTLPELMLRYRAAAFFIRLYAPETTLGLYTKEELYDVGEIIDVTPTKAVQEEINEKANAETIDITGEPVHQEKPSPDDELIVDDTATPEMTDEEKAEIAANEQADSQQELKATGTGGQAETEEPAPY